MFFQPHYVEYSLNICVYSRSMNATAIGKYSSFCIWWLIFCFMPKSTAKVIWSRNLSLKSHSKDSKSQGLSPKNLGIQVYSLTTTPEELIAVGPAFDMV